MMVGHIQMSWSTFKTRWSELNLNKPTEEAEPETVTTPQPPSNDQEEWINIPNNQPQLNQQQTIPNQQTTTQGNLNLEPSYPLYPHVK